MRMLWTNTRSGCIPNSRVKPNPGLTVVDVLLPCPRTTLAGFHPRESSVRREIPGGGIR